MGSWYKAIVFSAVACMATGVMADENSLTLLQVSGSTVSIAQASGSNDVYSILLSGENGRAELSQMGVSEQAHILQTGSNNFASITQTGSFDVASVVQNGSGNRVTIHQR